MATYHKVYMKQSRLFIILMLLMFIGLPVGCQITIWYRLSNSALVPIANNNIQKTAEYLYYNPLPLPVEIDRISGDINAPDDLCAYGSFAKNSLLYGISWIINGKRIPDWMYHTGSLSMLDDDNVTHFSCLTPYMSRWLYPGFHLIELHSQSNPLDPGMSYQFGVKINDVIPTPTP